MLHASAFDRDAAFGAWAICAPQNAERLEAAFREEIAAVLERGFTAEEVAEAKSGWLKSRLVSRGQDRELAGTLGGRAYEDRTLAWDADLERRVGELTPEAIHGAMRKHIALEKMTVVMAGDFARVKAEATKPTSAAPVEKSAETAQQ
jgi:zinc protease